MKKLYQKSETFKSKYMTGPVVFFKQKKCEKHEKMVKKCLKSKILLNSFY